jgi:hypothetical protein
VYDKSAVAKKSEDKLLFSGTRRRSALAIRALIATAALRSALSNRLGCRLLSRKESGVFGLTGDAQLDADRSVVGGI